MKKFKALISTLLVIVLLIGSLSMTSCSKSYFPDILSGEKFDLDEAYLKIKKDIKVAKEKDNYISDLTFKIDVNGYKEFSYFDGSISFTWLYEVLLDDSEGYVEDSYTTTLELGPDGKATVEKEVITLEKCRSVRNVKCEMSFEGYVIKK